MKLKLGLVINPLAGIGGSVALKGSDGAEVAAEALRRGAKPHAIERATRTLKFLENKPVQLLTWGGKMGADAAVQTRLDYRVVGTPNAETSAQDTCLAIQGLVEEGIDLLVFVGGDGTARNVLEALHTSIPVLGVPAGCKMHSGVYANNPEDAGKLLQQLVDGGLVNLVEADVRDIDEAAFRNGIVKAKHYGYLRVPEADGLIQQVKTGGKIQEAVVLTDIAAFVSEEMKPDVDYLAGSGSTVAAVMDELGLPNTLLGVDLVRNDEVIAADVSAQDILRLTGTYPLRAIVTIIGGQGHLFGRGNQQFSPDVIRRIGIKNFTVLATRQKLAGLAGRPLKLDTGDADLDAALTGWISVITGYDEQVLYQLGNTT